GTVLVSIEVAAGGRGAAASAGAAAPAAAPTPAARAGATSATGVATGAQVQATPAVRQLARELGVALERVAASGEGGRITAEDVRRAAGTGSAAAGVAPNAAATSPSSARAGAEERIPLRGLRRRIAETMRRSLDTAAHYTFVAECDMSAVAAH